MRLGIIAALYEEIAELLEQMGPQMEKRTIGMRTFYHGHVAGQDCVVVLARVGKVAVSATCMTLIHVFGVDAIVFAGVAGGIRDEVNVGDIVIGTEFCQHDLNAEPLFPRYQVPLLDKAIFESSPALSQALYEASKAFVTDNDEHSLSQMVSVEIRQQFHLNQMKIYQGLILSGDQFIGSHDAVEDLQQRFPTALCTEMEGAAIAQICYEHDIPFAVMRVISDKANNEAHTDFSRFLREVAPFISSGVLFKFLKNLKNPV